MQQAPSELGVNSKLPPHRFLVNEAGFALEDIVTIYATQDTTPDDIRQVFASAKADVANGWTEQSYVFVAYSGHGTFKMDFDGDELDAPASSSSGGGGGFGGGFGRLRRLRRLKLGKDEILAVHSGCQIVDDEVHDLLDFGDKSSVFAVLDCCHSGTMADLQYQYKPAPGGAGVEEPTKSTKSGASPLHRVVTISGCSDTQESKMSKLDGEVVGNLSKALLIAWRAPGGLPGLAIRAPRNCLWAQENNILYTKWPYKVSLGPQITSLGAGIARTGGFLRPFVGSLFAETQKNVLKLSQGTHSHGS